MHKLRPCTEDLSYDYETCIDLSFSKMRGCQAPWHYYNNSDISICQNASYVQQMFSGTSGIQVAKDYFDRPHMSTLFLSQITGCPLPCTSKKYMWVSIFIDCFLFVVVQIYFLNRPTYSYNIIGKWHWLKPMENGADWTVHLWFKNFLITYEKEYVVCDWSCLIGEIGGNLGFFLGGSILAFTDTLLSFIKQRLAKC